VRLELLVLGKAAERERERLCGIGRGEAVVVETERTAVDGDKVGRMPARTQDARCLGGDVEPASGGMDHATAVRAHPAGRAAHGMRVEERADLGEEVIDRPIAGAGTERVDAAEADQRQLHVLAQRTGVLERIDRSVCEVLGLEKPTHRFATLSRAAVDRVGVAMRHRHVNDVLATRKATGTDRGEDAGMRQTQAHGADALAATAGEDDAFGHIPVGNVEERNERRSDKLGHLPSGERARRPGREADEPVRPDVEEKIGKGERERDKPVAISLQLPFRR
jgi:hypothetical protein